MRRRDRKRSALVLRIRLRQMRTIPRLASANPLINRFGCGFCLGSIEKKMIKRILPMKKKNCPTRALLTSMVQTQPPLARWSSRSEPLEEKHLPAAHSALDFNGWRCKALTI